MYVLSRTFRTYLCLLLPPADVNIANPEATPKPDEVARASGTFGNTADVAPLANLLHAGSKV